MIIAAGMYISAENRDENQNRSIGRFNERSSILDRSLSHSKHVTRNKSVKLKIVEIST